MNEQARFRRLVEHYGGRPPEGGQGKDAYAQGKAGKPCTYPSGSALAAAWRAGYIKGCRQRAVL